MAITYKDAGVDIIKGDEFVKRIEGFVKSTYNKAVKSGVGGFASLYKIGKNEYLAAGTDGVGTKLMLAHQLNRHDTVGIDLVAMCVNDVVCTGARPLFFLDYIGCGKLDISVSEQIVKGIADGCRQAGAALVGGETAEMPGMYDDGEYDLAGFAVGIVNHSNLIDGKTLKSGDVLIGLASSGAHSNGFSLIRKLIKGDEKALLQKAMVPTKIYVKSILKVLEKKKFYGIKGLAHITGSGFYNIARMNFKFNYVVDQKHPRPEIFEILKKRSGLDQKEMYSTFNMGVGFVIACEKNKAAALMKKLNQLGETAFPLGHVVKGKGDVIIQNHAETILLPN